MKNIVGQIKHLNFWAEQKMENKINKGDLVRLVLGKKSGIVMRIDRWVPSGKIRALVHFYDGFENWINLTQLEKLNK